ncbi:uncharacterized protein B0P05DRAFT_526155 [Gilbertella persicaria]|uniref:uncharacterized protein n=1 Tax=Gilbertella persicaria TaxID=101096 RepID=UPI0022204B25|nr:uncharacterized protein B0P05DRAFT_526155 [Gilbertella persicaria]KAI8092413.1 hypothetical protein B0P05DRAFT_526155 [Gilbertella persicaria]
MYSPVLTPVENPRLNMDYPPTINDKELFRLSITSQSSGTTTTASTSSQRLSVASNEEEPTHIAFNISNSNHSLAGTTSLSPSSRYLLSGFSTSENLRNKVLSRFYPSSSSCSSPNRHQKSLSDPSISISSLDSSTESPIEPWCMSAKTAIETCILSAWMNKYEQPVFAFSRSWKQRLFVLVDRIVFVFKSNKPTNPARDYFVLTEDTFVFVTEQFKKGYVIELQKPLSKWYIRCDSIDQLKEWLEAMKKIVACIKIGYDGRLNGSILKSITLTDDYRILIPSHVVAVNIKKSYRQSLPVTTNELVRKLSIIQPKRKQKRQSLAEIPDWESTLPPQLPPPTSKPPPVPLGYSSSTSTTNNNDLPTVSEND